MTTSRLKFSNPIIKDEIEIQSNSGGELVFTTLVKPGGKQAGVHYHTKITEVFTIISGELNVNVNKVPMILKKGQTLVIRPFDRHQFLNESSKDVLFKVQVTAAGDMQMGLQIIYGLANDKKVFKNGLPKNSYQAAIAIKMMDAFIPGVPLIIQKTGINVIAFIGSVIGVKKRLIARYCS